MLRADMPASATSKKQNGLLRGMLDGLRGAKARLQGSRPVIDENTRRYIEFNRRKWPRNFPIDKNAVILVGLFDYRPSIHCYSYLTNYLARRTHSAIETFAFAQKISSVTEATYASFGARRGLTYADAERFRAEAASQADTIFAGLKDKWDVLKITVDGVLLGDLIYDTYLRRDLKATIDLRSETLRAWITDAIAILRACREYFAHRQVRAIICDHTVYIQSGILVRLASLMNIPVYMLQFRSDFFVIRLDPELPEGNQSNARRWPYYKYRQLFAELTQEEQEAARAKARKNLDARLAGKIDDNVLKGISAYTGTGDKIFHDSGEKPRVVILLHDFCDSVHKYRDMLFVDYYDWVHYLFDRARQTDFAWYAKPHPNNLLGDEKVIINNAVIGELKKEFPHITFLDPAVSNRQMVNEGIRAVFTVHGTGGHEFAYMGTPVVNAGDNLHITYDFNLHPKSLEEYGRYIANAGSLELKIDKLQVEEFFYMHHYYFPERLAAKVHPIESTFLNAPDFQTRAMRSEAYLPFIQGATPERDKDVLAYFNQYFATQPGLVFKS